ncbi:1,3-beta-glucanosyltransferase gel3 precursor [Pleomassaria siparia CBS 279.74]|uniref:1,3-beta-glucanosyltransferase n=1 Tax=Pleomassaria siparia CBS 279.74 TaxID=1314801 RepID=A0A6G1JVW8_9PLEO|nr:1,3-beta-glucanosyltransferase gel3 precursor [Pleomassaria siparia CBS 279.74]
MRTTLFASALAGLAAVSNAIPTISVKGSKFFTSDGNQFFVKGIAYQLVPDDPLIDSDQCKLDAALMKTIGTNSIRVYHVDSSVSHKDCMQSFEDAGIYIWLDLDTFSSAIFQDAPHWNVTQRDAFGAVMDEFHQYDNLAGFFVGNEVLTTKNGSISAPFVKAATRDLKAYRDSKGYRNIPIGYSAADIAELRPTLQNYLSCGSNSSEQIDFYALNAYEWCGDQNFQTSGYQILTNQVLTYNVPIFFSETGCQTVRPRTFEDQTAIYGSQMTPYWSGSIIYEWIEEANNYGLIQYGAKVDPSSPGAPPDGFPRSGKPTPLQPEWGNLSKVWAAAKPSGVSEAAYKPSLTAPACPEMTAGTWNVDGAAALPTLGQTFEAQATNAPTVSSSGAAPTGTQAQASPSGTSGVGSPAKELRGMGVGLVGVLVGFFWWM